MAQGPVHLDAQRIKKETLTTSVQQPVAVYPTSIGVLAGAYALMFGGSVLSIGVMTGGLALGLSGWLFEYFGRGKKHALRIVQKYRESLHKKRVHSIDRVHEELASLEFGPGLSQLEQLIAKFDNFEGILSKKLDESELTYSRYLAMAEQVFLNALDNLEQLAFGLQSVSAIDLDRVMRSLGKLDESDPARAPLLARRQLCLDQQEEAKKLLLENEYAMTQLDRVTSNLATIQTRAGRAQMDMDVAMQGLEDLIERAHKYNR